MQDQRLLLEVLNQMFWGWWILMAAANVHVADPLVPSIEEQLILEKEPAGQYTQWIYSGSDKGLLHSGPHSVGKFIYRSRGILLHKGALSSTVWDLSYYCMEERKKGKGLEVPCKYS